MFWVDGRGTKEGAGRKLLVASRKELWLKLGGVVEMVKGSHSGYISKTDPAEFPDYQDVECERKEESMMTLSF